MLVTRHALNIQHIALNIKRYSIFSIQKEEKNTCEALADVFDKIHSIEGEDMNKTAKMMIASNGRQSAVLLDGVMIGVGVDGVRLDVKEGVSKLSITGIDVARFRAGTEEDFERFCTGLSGNELSGE